MTTAKLIWPNWAARSGQLVYVLWIAAVWAQSPLLSQPKPEHPQALLTVLSDTGEVDNDLPRLVIHPDESEIVSQLSHGFMARLLRVYRAEQIYLNRERGTAIEPAYLLLSDNQGGFPRYGFVLDRERKSQAAFVDLHKSSPLTGRWGAVDQIFPHELGHILIRQTVGELQGGGANQIHAIALRTDRPTAFNEGFGEHFQIMAIDDPKAPADTSQLRLDRARQEEADAAIELYGRELESRWALGAPARLRFLFWFSRAEDVLRYHGVKENLFAFKAQPSPELSRGDRLFNAYLLESIVPAKTLTRRKSRSILLASEGVVSTFFWRWATNSVVQGTQASAELYETFDMAATSVDAVENAYLKLVHVFATSRPNDVLEFSRAYQSSFPAEAAAIDQILEEVFFASQFEAPPEIWLANDDFQTGTTLFDQYRGLPRPHTFDLNAATEVDLMGIPGMTLDTAQSILGALPLHIEDVAEIGGVFGVTPTLTESFRRMQSRMEELRGEDPESTADLSLSTILAPFAYRALTVLAIVGLLAAVPHLLIRGLPWYRSLLNGYAVSLVSLGIVWLLTGKTGWHELVFPLILIGLPAAFWKFLKTRERADAWLAFTTWASSLIPAWIALRPW